MADVKSFVIDRAKWGKGSLLNDDGSMCCLGFLGKACGAELVNTGYPMNLPQSEIAKFPEWVCGYGEDMERLVALNDGSAPTFGGARRCKADVEKYITKTFAKHGIRVTFRGKAKKAVKS